MKQSNLIQSEKFKKWFGNSKVVDSNGNPLIVYHGTLEEIGVFDKSSDFTSGFGFFTELPQQAGNFIRNPDEIQRDWDSDGVKKIAAPQIIPVYLSIQNPFDFKNKDHYEKLLASGYAHNVDLGNSWELAEYSEIMKSFGFDGAKLYETTSKISSTPITQWVPFRQTQIKSAYGNNGNFDSNNPDINEGFIKIEKKNNTIMLNEIRNIAKNESSFFQVEQKGSKYNVFLSEEFKKTFTEEVVSTNQIFIDEAKKKFGDKIKIENKNGIIMLEAEDKKDKPLNKPMKGDVKKYKVYVKDPKTGNIKKVNFGDKNMEIKRDNPERKKSFRARHKCDQKKDKTKAGYWSCKFWDKKPVGDLLNEIVDPDTIDVERLKVKDELCPDVWKSEDKIRPEVRKALLKNALEFIKFSNLEEAKFNDIILTGSMANYNWHEGSDLDVHVLLDLDHISSDKELAYDYFKTKKSLWGDKLPVKVAGHDVELYVQDINEPHASTGVYSLLDDEWLTKPIKKMVALDIPNIQAKASDFMNAIDDLESNANAVSSIDSIEKLKDKLAAYRKAGLDEKGEYSTENLVFKILRNTGYLEKLSKLKDEVLTKNLTLENVSMYNPNIMEEGTRDKIMNAVRQGTLGLGIVVALLAGGLTMQDLQRDFEIPPEMVQKAEEFINMNVSDTLGIKNDR